MFFPARQCNLTTKMRPFFCCLIFLLPILSWAKYSPEQEKAIDSLQNIVAQGGHDSTIINAWVALDYIIYKEDPELDIRLNEMIDSLCQENLQNPLSEAERRFFQVKSSFALNGLGLIYRNRGEYEQAVDLFNRSGELARQAGEVERETKALGNMGRVYLMQGDFDEALRWYQKGLDRSIEEGFRVGTARGYMFLGLVHKAQGDHEAALEDYQNSLEHWTDGDNPAEVASVYSNIAQIMIVQGDLKNAIIHTTSALQVFEANGDYWSVANTYAEIGSIYMMQKDYPRALENYEKSMAIAEKAEYMQGVSLAWASIGEIHLDKGDSTAALDAFFQALEINRSISDKPKIGGNLNQIGTYYRLHGDLDTALVYIQQGLEIREEIGDENGKAGSLLELARAYGAKGASAKAIAHAEEALGIARSAGSINLIRDASRVLYQEYRDQGRTVQALAMHEQYIYARDSIESESNHKEIVRQEYRSAYERKALVDSLAFVQREAVKDLEIENQRVGLSRQRILLGFSLVAVLLLVALGVVFYRGKKRSDLLLHNILPEEVAKELKAHGHSQARDFEEVTILFTDFVGFTKLSSQVSASELVQEIDTCFSAFDRIIEKYGLEKIKTIGDAYMAAGGLPQPGKVGAAEVIKAGLEMQAFMQDRYQRKTSQGKKAFEMRAGIHTGPAVAGIVGVKKFQYDIWGDTVNIASRMESNGEINEVNISQATYLRVQSEKSFRFESRGKVEVKGKGEMEMFFVMSANNN